jgi:catechol 2,3-dioxygenase-like lactoylglutathione lyase family enzyme
MTIRLDHTIVPAKDKQEAAALFAELFGLTVKPRPGYFAQVQINESLTFDFADAVEFEDPTAHHYAFHVSDDEFEGIWSRVKAKGMGWGNAPDNSANGKLYHLRGGRGFYFRSPDGHLLEVMTVQETGS